MRRLLRYLGRAVVYAVALVLIVVGLFIGGLETRWGKNRLRGLIVREANLYLTATLEIGELRGSIFRGLELNNVRLSRDGAAIIDIDQVSLSYSIRELLDQGTTIRRIRLVRPRVVAKKESDGRWNLAALVRRTARDRDRTGPGRPIHIDAIEVDSGSVVLKDSLTFGAAHVPSRFERLNLALAFSYVPVSWRLEIARGSWLGGATDIAVDRLSGTIASGRDGLTFENLVVATAQSAVTTNGRVVRGDRPATFDLHVIADRFVFQEWASVLPALQRFPIDSKFDAHLSGPLAALATRVDFQSNAGAARGTVTLDTTVPGWRGVGALDLVRLDLAPWFNNPARRSDVSGHAEFNLALQLGRGVPQGTYSLVGPHAAYGGYEADQVNVRGNITDRDWHITAGSAKAYGADVTLAQSTITLADPFRFHFQGHAANVDLQVVPANVPVPHVESTLAMDYNVTGQFVRGFIAGSAVFGESTFLDARIASGAEGWIDTSVSPVHYKGSNVAISGIDLNRLGSGLDVEWMRDPRYAGSIAGTFAVEGDGFDSETMSLTATGTLAPSSVFHGTLTGGAVDLKVENGSLAGGYRGGFQDIDPAVPFADEQWKASLTGNGTLQVSAPELLLRTLDLEDYDITAAVTFAASDIRNVHVDRGAVTATISDGILNASRFELAGPLVEGSASGQLALVESAESQFSYTIARADLGLLRDQLGDIAGQLTTEGTVSGPRSALSIKGTGSGNRIQAPSVSALAVSGDYQVTMPLAAPADAAGTFTGSASFVDIFGRTIEQASGSITYANSEATTTLDLVESSGLKGTVAAQVRLHPDGHAVDLKSASIEFGGTAWRTMATTPPPVVSWNDDGVSVETMTLTSDPSETQRIEVGGTWRPAGGGALNVKASNVSIDTLSSAFGEPTIYGGTLGLNATLSGTQDAPIVTGQIDVIDGRIRRLSYQRLAGRVDYRRGDFDIDIRLDQSPNVWLAFTGSVPPTLFSEAAPERPVSLKIVSSDIDLGLLEGLTDIVRDVTGKLRTNLEIAGTTREPVFSGPIELTGVGFQVVSSGARYQNGAVSLELTRDLIDVKAFRLEDRRGSALAITGALGTQEFRVGEFNVDIVARKFEVLRNELGTVEVDATLGLRGRFDAPRLYGDVTIAGGQINTDEVLSRSLLRPYATQALVETTSPTTAIDAINPWNRMSLDVAVHSQNALRLIGDNIAVTDTAPLGLGSFDLRASGDIYLYKEPAKEMSINGSLDSISGSYSFQGRRFELYPSSSVDFRGDLNPSLFVSVNRVISGVETRVTISGSLNDPELQLSSTPTLDPTDILSLIVFNASSNELNTAQQRELAIRAGTLAVGFLTSSLTAALEQSLGIDILEVEPVTGVGGGAKVTIGEEIAPGLVARFSRQFGTEQYDEAVLEYYISRILRIRATFSDADQSIQSSPFRRVEYAGIDFLITFSF